MNRTLHFAVLFAAVLLVAADKKPEKTKEPAPSASQIQQWVKQLGDEKFNVREEAAGNLTKAWRVAFDAVTKATKSKDAEVKQRALRILKQIGKEAKVLIRQGISWYNKGEYDKAIADFNEAIRLNPKDSVAYYTRGAVWTGKGELDNAVTDFAEAIRLKPLHKRAAAAGMQIGHIEFHRARSLKKLADDALPAKKDASLKKAREHYKQANLRYAAAEKRFRELRNRYPAFGPPATKRIRDEFRVQMLTVGMRAAETLRELGNTFKDGSREKKDFLKKAAAAYGKFYERYDRWTIGHLANLLAARCLQEIGDKRSLEQAMDIYDEYLEYEDEVAIEIAMKTRATTRKVECLCLPVAGKKYADAIKLGDDRLNLLPKLTPQSKDLSKDLVWLKLRYQTALAHELLASAEKNPTKKKKHLATSLEYARFIAKESGELQHKAKQLQKKLEGGGALQR